jgi:hypothetical protein
MRPPKRWHPALNASFLNVGQGDATLVHYSSDELEWRALIDAGWEHEIRPHLPWLEDERRIDLIVGTHCDGDHLEGLCLLVEESELEIGCVLLPPFVHPTGGFIPTPGLRGIVPGSSPFAAEHIARGGIEAALGGEERMVIQAELPSRLLSALDEASESVLGAGIEESESDPVEFLGWEAGEPERDEHTDVHTDERPPSSDAPDVMQSGSAWESELSSRRLASTATRLDTAGLPGLAETARQLAEFQLWPSAQRTLALALHRRTHDPLAQERAVATVRAAAEVAADGITCTLLERLITALNQRGIPWFVQAAPDVARPEGRLVEAWHLAPTGRYIEGLARHLPVIKDALLRATYVDPGLPSYANRLSHVLAFRGSTDPVGLMVTGDSGFQRGRGGLSDCMASGWERTLSWATLVDVPHHGGTSGHFGRRLLEALGQQRPGGPMHLYLSVRHPNQVAPPHKRFDSLLAELDSRSIPFVLRMSALPRQDALDSPWRSEVRPQSKSRGAERVSLCQCCGDWSSLDGDKNVLTLSSP